jgi:hypothetical protein
MRLLKRIEKLENAISLQEANRKGLYALTIEELPVTDRPKGAGDDRPNGATRRGCFWVSGVVRNSLKAPFCQAIFS